MTYVNPTTNKIELPTEVEHLFDWLKFNTVKEAETFIKIEKKKSVEVYCDEDPF